MRRPVVLAGTLILAAAGLGACSSSVANREGGMNSVLRQEFDLGKARTPGTRYFDMVTRLTTLELDGTRGDTESFRMKLACVSHGDARGACDEYTCQRFLYVKARGSRAWIPAMEGWRHTFRKTADGCDAEGHVFGIDHATFQRLTEEDGTPLPPDKAYMIYNTFIDFHGFCDGFGTPADGGKGVQDLTRIGQQIVHAAAHTTPPTNVGGMVKDGSHFKNGEITLRLKGLSVVDDAACAVVEFDSGVSSFLMLMEPMRGMEVKTRGTSHYFGDLYIDLVSHWPRRVEMRELVVSETNVPMPPKGPARKISSVIERYVLIKAVTKEDYEADF